MKYLVSAIIISISIMGIVTALSVQTENEVVADRGYECFNLEVAQAQLMYVRAGGSRGEIYRANRSVKNWERLCNVELEK